MSRVTVVDDTTITLEMWAADTGRVTLTSRLPYMESGILNLLGQTTNAEITYRPALLNFTPRVQAKSTGAAGKFSPRHGATSGYASHQGLLVEADWLGFKDAPTGLPAMIDWLCRRRCVTIKYDIISTSRPWWLA